MDYNEHCLGNKERIMTKQRRTNNATEKSRLRYLLPHQHDDNDAINTLDGKTETHLRRISCNANEQTLNSSVNQIFLGRRRPLFSPHSTSWSTFLLLFFISFHCINLSSSNEARSRRDIRFVWRTGAWGKCVSLSCGAGGIQDRTVNCIYANRAWLTTHSNCESQEKPIDRRSCFKVCDEHQDMYRWKVGEWQECQLVDSAPVTPLSGDTCGLGFIQIGSQRRNITCVDVDDESLVMDNYVCKRFSSAPSDTRVCEVPCPINCVTSHWSDWSKCSKSCGNGTQYRTRSVLTKSQYGGSDCPSLSSTRSCPDLPDCGIDPILEILEHVVLKFENWSKCRAARIELSSSFGGKRRKEQRRKLAQVQKTLVGRRERRITCLNEEGESVGDSVSTYETCTVTKNCDTTSWAAWSVCYAPCGTTGNQTRTREVKTLPSGPGAVDCPLLEETRKCQIDQNLMRKCTRYTWVTGGWTECETIGNATCGGGIQNRDVYCVVKDEFTIYQALTAAKLGGKVGLKEWAKMQPVDDRHCEKKYKPSIWQECDVICPAQCIVGPWSEWSECAPEDCRIGAASLFSPDTLIGRRKASKNGFKRRIREILQSSDGTDGCPHTSEVIPCEESRCYRWYAGETSLCVATSGECGEGTRTQDVICRDLWGRQVEEQNCRRKPAAPPMNSTLPCFVPCNSDCVIGDWSTWTPCTHICKRGRRESGNQTRFREILANPGPGGKECPSKNQLNESRLCNQHRCSVYYWDVGQWSDCLVKDSVTPTVPSHGLRTSDMFMSDDGNSSKPLFFPSEDTVPVCGTGYQNRVVKCRKKDSGEVRNELCGRQRAMPLRTRDCTFPCPRDCVVSGWSDWSDCKEECDKVARPGKGSPGPVHQRRHRAVIQHRTGRGTPCPFELTQKRQCIESEKCMSYRWRVSEWSECVLTHGAASIFSDGTSISDVLCVGAMTRKIQCRQFSSNGESVNVDYRLCLKYGGDPIPEGAQYCLAECKPDKSFIKWQDKIGCLTTVKKFGETVEELYGLVDIEDDQSYLSRQRTARPVGEWSSCNISKPNDPSSASLLGKKMWKPYCGQGTRRMALACYVEGTSIIVDNSYCGYMYFQEESCEIPCPVDCKMSEWSSWGKCGDSNVGKRDAAIAGNLTSNISEVEPPCGENVQMRYRFISNKPKHGGRACPIVDSLGLEYDIKPCHTVCNSLFWVSTSWTVCQVNKYGAFSNCGSGLQFRNSKCYETDRATGYSNIANVVTDHLCNLETIPYGTRTCSAPCPGECVYSEWSSWQKCVSPMGPNVVNSCDGTRKRTKALLRRADVEAVVQKDAIPPNILCGNEEIVEEAEDCQININCFTYSAMWTEWSSCSLSSSASCGTGSRERRSNCISSSGLPVHADKCLSNNVPLPPPERESCRVACPVDCDVAEWTPWSTCTDGCDDVVVRNRTRKVIGQPSAGGRPCPVTLETTPCPTSQCHTWKLGQWSDCKIAGGNCGTGLQFREVQCIQHDGVVVSNALCEKQQKLDRWFGDSMLRRDCQVACAGECHMTQWSQWGDCHLHCLDVETPVAGAAAGVQSRSRVGFIVGQVSEGDCPSKEIEEKSCNLDDAKCYIYEWKTGTFYKGKRPVWCERTIDRMNVSSGCQEQLRPQEELYCIQHCDDIPFSYCTNDGVCDCDVGYRAISRSGGILESCVETQPNDEAKTIQVIETMKEIPEIDQRSVRKGTDTDNGDDLATTTELEVSTATTAVVKQSNIFDDLGLLTEDGQLKVWVYGVIVGIVIFIIFMIAVIYLICVSCRRKKTSTTMYGSYPSRSSSSSRRKKRRHNSSGSNVGVGMVIGMGTARFPPSNSAMSHTSSTSRSGFSYPDQYGSDILWKEN